NKTQFYEVERSENPSEPRRNRLWEAIFSSEGISMKRSLNMNNASRLVAAALLASAGLTGVARADDGRFHGNYDPALDVCRGTDPICYHDWAGDDGQRQGNRVLLYTRTAGPRHANLGPRLAAGLNPPLVAGNVVQNTLKTWLEAEGITMDW